MAQPPQTPGLGIERRQSARDLQSAPVLLTAAMGPVEMDRGAEQPLTARQREVLPHRGWPVGSRNVGSGRSGEQLAGRAEDPQLEAGRISGADGVVLDQSIGWRARLVNQAEARQHRRQRRRGSGQRRQAGL